MHSVSSNLGHDRILVLTSPYSTPAKLKPLLAQKLAQKFLVMLGEVVDAPVRARPLVPSAMHPRSVHPGVMVGIVSSNEGEDILPQEAGWEKSVRTGLQPGRAERAEPSSPTFSLGISAFSVQALATASLM